MTIDGTPMTSARSQSPDSMTSSMNQVVYAEISAAVGVARRGEDIVVAGDLPLGARAVQGRHVAEQIRAGTVWINGGGSIRTDAPFGGYGRSGIGREFGEWGMREYFEVKPVAGVSTAEIRRRC